MRNCYWTCLLLIGVGLGCQSSRPPTSTGERPDFVKIEEQNLPDAIRQKFRLENNGREVWLYRPQTAARGYTILIPASAGNGISGGRLDTIDELLARGFVQLGLTVAAYDVGETTPLDADSIDDFKRAIHSVIDDGGLSDTHNAISVASLDSPNDRFVTLGRGPAASIALRAAADDQRIEACVMIDPPISIKSGTTEVVIDSLATSMPELVEFLQTDDFAPVVRRTNVPLLVVSIVQDDSTAAPSTGNPNAKMKSPGAFRARGRSFDDLLADPMKISSLFPGDILPNQGFVQMSEWMTKQRRMPGVVIEPR